MLTVAGQSFLWSWNTWKEGNYSKESLKTNVLVNSMLVLLQSRYISRWQHLCNFKVLLMLVENYVSFAWHCSNSNVDIRSRIILVDNFKYVIFILISFQNMSYNFKSYVSTEWPVRWLCWLNAECWGFCKVRCTYVLVQSYCSVSFSLYFK